MIQTAQRYAMMTQLSRVGKRSRHYYSHFICSSSTSLSPRSARCRIIPSTYNHARWSSGSSSNNNKTRSIFRKMGKSAKKKLLRQLSKGKSVRQQSIENDIDIDVYSRAEDSHTGYDFMVV